jgi:hypothetical protein
MATTRLLCTCFLLRVKGWACGNSKLSALSWACGSNKLLHLLKLVAITSFSTYLGLMLQQASTITFYCGLKVCNIQT